MKKQTLKSLSLNKKTVSKLDQDAKIIGGANDSTLCVTMLICITESHIFVCCPPEPSPVPPSDPAICTGGWGNCPIN